MVVRHPEVRTTAVLLIIVEAAVLLRLEAVIRAEAVAVPDHRIVVEAEVHIHPEAVEAVAVVVEDKHELQKLKL